MEFAIYYNNQWNYKKANLQAISEDVKDETLDTACIELYFDERAEAYPPRALCLIIDENGEDEAYKDHTYYHVATDNVEIQTLDPRTYKHTLTLVQTTRKLSHYVLPNMVIRKPREGVVSTYFANVNQLNQAYYCVNREAQPSSGLGTWAGFTCHGFKINATPLARSGIHSPYWAECVALSANNKVRRARIKVSLLAMVCTYEGDGDGIKNVTATPTLLTETPTAPSWLMPYLRVYYSAKNINMANFDESITKVEIAKVKLSSIAWDGTTGYIDLTDEQLATLNGYDSGYVACELYSEVTGTIPTAFYDDVSEDYIYGLYDRLFVDITELGSHNIQAVWSNVQLELTYKQLSLYDTLKKIIARQQCVHSSSTNLPLFYLPVAGDDYNTLVNTESPEFTFNSLTVFEAVSQVLETIDALPRFDCDYNNGRLTLALDYFNQTGAEISTDTKFTAYSSNATEQKRDNGILTNFQNAEMVCHFPCKPFKGIPSYARASVSSYGTPELSDFCLMLDKPIKYIKHLWVKFTMKFGVCGHGTTYSWGGYKWVYKDVSIDFPIDLASFIFDDSTYSSALDQRSGYTYSYNHNERLQLNCLRFKKGGKSITIGNKATNEWNKVFSMFKSCCDISRDRFMGLYCINHNFPSTSDATTSSLLCHIESPKDFDFKNVWFSCEYASDIDGRLEVQSPYKKEEGQFISSTGSSSPDIGKLGLNMLGVALKSGEPTMTCSQMLTKWVNRIKVGDIFTKDDEKWIATKASYTRLTSGDQKEIIKGTIEFTKNFNGLSKRIAIDQSKRLYNIDRNIASLCEPNIIEYVYFEPLPYGATLDKVKDDCPFLGSNVSKIIMKAFDASEDLYADVSFAMVADMNTANLYSYIPLSVYGAGNCLCFEAKYDDPISAGVRMSAQDEGATGLWWLDWTSKVNDSTYYYGSDVKYTDSEGYREKFTIKYLYNDGVFGDFSNSLPLCWDAGWKVAGQVTDLEFNKQPNEIFGLNYELAFLSRYNKADNEVFFGKAFFDTWNELTGRKTTNLYFYWSTTETYGFADRKGKGNKVACYLTSGYDSNGERYFQILSLDTPLGPFSYDLTSFALCDQDGNMLIACNCKGVGCKYAKTKMSTGTTYLQMPKLHFFTKKERL